ncbi:DUF4878 domain-containing protein [Dysgonomonas sp. 520]|uniref:DUF4878 domain-containing protein n=1 Tax=Dysgonomonas sp. 520 TaxID=2302931 RepID=UPI0013D35641|nr:DUF4878 domain-containing protein [Dysgonomonas sp. 520]
MKKILYLSLLFAFAFSFSSCSDSPESAAKRYVEYMAEGKFEKLMDNGAKPDHMTNDEFKEMKRKMKDLIEAHKDEIKERIKDYKIDKIEVVPNDEGEKVTYLDNDKTEARVYLKVTFKNGKIEEDRVRLVKQDGKWKFEDSGFSFAFR